MSINSGSLWTSDEVAEVAGWQKYLIWLIFVQIISVVLFFITVPGGQTNDPGKSILLLIINIGRMIVSFLCIYCVYKMAKSLRKGCAAIYAIAMLLPVISLLVLVHLNAEATKLLQDNGIRVGIMGANSEDLSSVRYEVVDDQSILPADSSSDT